MASAGTSRLLLLEILLPLLLLALLPTFQAGGADSPCSPRPHADPVSIRVMQPVTQLAYMSVASVRFFARDAHE